MRITGGTQVCISIAARPSNFGMTLHNAAYEAAGLDFIYKAFRVLDVRGAVEGVRALGIRGMSVSMPHKQTVLAFLDALDPSAESIDAVNTVVNDGERLTGYNTDAYGAGVAFSSLEPAKGDRILILGAGGVARAVVYALREIGDFELFVSNRSPEKSAALAQKWNAETIPWSERGRVEVEHLVNATSIGMAPDDEEMPVDPGKQPGLRGVMDVVLTPMTSKLVRRSAECGLRAVPGYVISLHQAAEQFRLYTGVRAPLDVMERALRGLLSPVEAAFAR